MNMRVMNERERRLAMELLQFAERLQRRPGRGRMLRLRTTGRTLGKALRALALVSLLRGVGPRRAGRIAALVIGARAERLGRRKHRFGG